jgi:hypothetical protein
MTSIVSCAADGAPAMMGKRNGCLQLMKNDHPSMMTVHCVIHRENLVAKSLSAELNSVMSLLIKAINSIKASAKTERLFKMFCKNEGEKFEQLLMHTQVRWLSKGKCLERFMQLFDSLKEFLGDKEEFGLLFTMYGRSMISYLADIFGMLNALNCDLQGPGKTLLDSKSKILGFTSRLQLLKEKISRRDFTSFPRYGVVWTFRLGSLNRFCAIWRKSALICKSKSPNYKIILPRCRYTSRRDS